MVVQLIGQSLLGHLLVIEALARSERSRQSGTWEKPGNVHWWDGIPGDDETSYLGEHAAHV